MTASQREEIRQYRGVPLERFVAEDGFRYRIFADLEAGRAMITPELGASLAAGTAYYQTLGLIDVTGEAGRFEQATLDYLAGGGRSCRVTDSHLITRPQWEVRFTCGEENATGPIQPR